MYSDMAHEHAADENVYAFDYDNMGANGQDFSETLSMQNASTLTIGIGEA